MYIFEHPFKKGVRAILYYHFGDEIAEAFHLSFEADHISKLESPAIFNQVRDNQLIMEVRYRNSDNTYEYICDLYPWDSRPKTESRLLKYITDAYKVGKIKGWTENNGRISRAVVQEIKEIPAPPEEELQEKVKLLEKKTGRKLKLRKKVKQNNS